MKITKDITDREDIKNLLAHFYHLALVDPLIGTFFTEVVQLDLDKHLDKIIDFWETMLFEGKKYQGDFLSVHLNVHQKKKIEMIHFERWLTLFFRALDEKGFSGPITEKIKEKARAIAVALYEKLK